MWDTEMVLLLRYMIDDTEEPMKYADERLMRLLLVAGQFAQTENIFAQDYTINVENFILKPDPTNINARDDAFINLTILKAACLLIRSSLPKANKQHISVIEGPYRFDGRGRIDGEQTIVTTWCEAYETARWEHSVYNADPGRTIIGPYRIRYHSEFGFGDFHCWR